MPPKAKELSAVAVRGLKARGRHPVGGVPGLLLNVTPAGSRSWILRVQVGAKRRDIGLGGYPEVSLARAREKARELREQVRDGVDVVAERRAARARLMADQAKALTFQDAARKCHHIKAQGFRNAKHRKDWISSIERYANPVIGSLDVRDVERAHIVKVLEPIAADRPETAQRLRQRIETVLNWATVSGHREGENPARWQGYLDQVLHITPKKRRTKHYAALPWQQVPEFMAALRQRDGLAPRALEFLILTAARSGEVRGATWQEIDLDAQTWTVPGERIKSGRPHRVPLTDDVVALLKALPRLEGSESVFPSPRGATLSDMALTGVLRRMGMDATVHGFRSSFKDWARSATAYPDEVSELALAHVSSDATRAAYARDELMPQRKRLMTEWARFCRSEKRSGDVVPMRGAK